MRNIFALVFLLAFCLGVVAPEARAGRAARAAVRVCIANTTQPFPKFARLVDQVRSNQRRWDSQAFADSYKAVVTELSADLGASLPVVFKVLRLCSKVHISNCWKLENLIPLLVLQLIVDPQRTAVEQAYKDLPEAHDHLESRREGMSTGESISSSPLWIRDVADELENTPGFNSFVDVGSGHGVPALLLSQEFPDAQFIGFDFVEAKIKVATEMAKRMELENVQFKHQDLMAPGFYIPVSDVYYFFNPARPEVIAHVARQIAQHAKTRDIKIISTLNGWVEEEFEKVGCKGVQKPRTLIRIITCPKAN